MGDALNCCDTLPRALIRKRFPHRQQEQGVSGRDTYAELDRFLAEVEKKAYQTARLAVGNREDALDIVQDAMLRFARKYRHNNPTEWRPLFQRILHNRIMDHHRRSTLTKRIFIWFDSDDPERNTDPIAEAVDTRRPEPVEQQQQTDAVEKLRTLLAELPLRQQQAFLLRIGEELSVSDTARVMGCSPGSVKAHLWRALEKLRAELGDFWDA